jgi:hypothetical protein
LQPELHGRPITQEVVPGLTDIAVIIDRSGSMEPLTDSTIQGFNGFLQEQQNVAGDARLTLTLFDTPSDGKGGIEVVYENVPIKHVAPLNRETYRPWGSTPLYEAVGKTLDRMRLAPKRGETVLVVIITDGYENASRSYSQTRVKSIIEQCKSQGWQFLFLGANIEKSVGHDLGIGNTYTYMATEQSVGNTYSEISRGVTQTRNSRGTVVLDVAEADLT